MPYVILAHVPCTNFFLTDGELNLKQHIPICKPFSDHHQQVFVSMPNPSSYRNTERVLSWIHSLLLCDLTALLANSWIKFEATYPDLQTFSQNIISKPFCQCQTLLCIGTVTEFCHEFMAVCPALKFFSPMADLNLKEHIPIFKYFQTIISKPLCQCQTLRTLSQMKDAFKWRAFISKCKWLVSKLESVLIYDTLWESICFQCSFNA